MSMLAAIDIPLWIQIFVVTGILLVIFVVPLRILWEMTKGGRERRQKVEQFADRLRERFDEVEIKRSLFGTDVLRFKHEGRPVAILLPEPEEILLRLEVKIQPKFPCVIRTKSGIVWPFACEGAQLLSRVPIHEPVLDDAVLVYSTSVFGGFLREMAQDSLRATGKPAGLTESIVVLRRSPGVRSFRLMMSESGGFRVRFRLRTEDLLYRPDELEAVIHHTMALYDALVLY